MLNITQRIKEIEPGIQRLRWEIHAQPELAWQERNTSALVEQRLTSLGLKVERLCGTGVVALLEGSHPGRTIALRADMDALTQTERTGCPHSSSVDGMMHACGHDVHTAILVGVAEVLSGISQQLHGNVKFIFQPAEEDGPIGGARLLIKEGVLSHLPVDLIVALHVWPDLPLGTIGLREGALMAASDRLTISLKGVGGHGAMPHRTADAVVAAAHIVTGIQSIVSRNVDPLEPAVITIGSIKGGNRHDTVAEEALLLGTCRTFSNGTRQLVKRRIEELSSQVASGFGVDCNCQYTLGYPPVINHSAAVDLVEMAAEESDLCCKVLRVDKPAMVAEDFAVYLEHVPGMLLWLGCGKGDLTSPLHSGNFLPPEECLPIGMEVLTRTVLKYLE